MNDKKRRRESPRDTNDDEQDEARSHPRARSDDGLDGPGPPVNTLSPTPDFVDKGKQNMSLNDVKEMIDEVPALESRAVRSRFSKTETTAASMVHTRVTRRSSRVSKTPQMLTSDHQVSL